MFFKPCTHGFDSCYPKKRAAWPDRKTWKDIEIWEFLVYFTTIYNSLQQFGTARGNSLAGRLEILIEVKSVMKITKFQTSFVSSFNINAQLPIVLENDPIEIREWKVIFRTDFPVSGGPGSAKSRKSMKINDNKSKTLEKSRKV